jgi:hypothetical protein
MASLIFARASFLVLPCKLHPGNEGDLGDEDAIFVLLDEHSILQSFGLGCGRIKIVCGRVITPCIGFIAPPPGHFTRTLRPLVLALTRASRRADPGRQLTGFHHQAGVISVLREEPLQLLIER